MQIEVRKPTEEEIRTAESWPIWEKEISKFSWSYDEKETCFILSGTTEVLGENEKKAVFGAGDWVVFPAGLRCIWKIKQPIKKRYNFGEIYK